jgi:predicted acyltransferase (DUF342 family)
MPDWLDLSTNSNLFVQAYVKGFVDISGGDLITRNGRLLINNDASLNSNVYVGDKLHVGIEESSYYLDVSGDGRFLNDVDICGNVSFNNVTFEDTTEFQTDVTILEGLDVHGKSSLVGDVSMNSNVDISGNLVVRGNLSVFQTKTDEVIHTTSERRLIIKW